MFSICLWYAGLKEVLVSTSAIKQEKQMNGIKIKREETKLSLFADNMIADVEEKLSSKKLVELITEFSKSITFPYIQKKKIKNLKIIAVKIAWIYKNHSSRDKSNKRYAKPLRGKWNYLEKMKSLNQCKDTKCYG